MQANRVCHERDATKVPTTKRKMSAEVEAMLVLRPKISVVKYVTVIGFRSVKPKINP